MSPAWLFASFLACLLGGVLLFRLVVARLVEGVPIWVIRGLGLVSFMLLVTGAHAGYMYRGVCYSDAVSAGREIASSLNDVDAVFQPVTLNGSPYIYWGSMANRCVYVSSIDRQVTVSCTQSPSVLAYGVNTGPVMPGGEPMISYDVTRYISPRSVDYHLPYCDIPSSPTSSDILYIYSWGAGSILSLWALGFAVGTARRVIRKS